MSAGSLQGFQKQGLQLIKLFVHFVKTPVLLGFQVIKPFVQLVPQQGYNPKGTAGKPLNFKWSGQGWCRIGKELTYNSAKPGIQATKAL